MMNPIATVALAGMAGMIGTAAVDVFPTGVPGGLDKLGIAGVAIWIMYKQLQTTREERDKEQKERQEIGARLEGVHNEIRKEHAQVILSHADALKQNAAAIEENARAAKHLADVLSKKT